MFSKGSVTIKGIKNDLKLAMMFLTLGLLFMKVALGTFRLLVNPGREQSSKMTSRPGAPKATYWFKKCSLAQAHNEITRLMCLILY